MKPYKNALKKIRNYEVGLIIQKQEKFYGKKLSVKEIKEIKNTYQKIEKHKAYKFKIICCTAPCKNCGGLGSGTTVTYSNNSDGSIHFWCERCGHTDFTKGEKLKWE
ncbi:MAG: hypothetical protein HY438_02215 [DPANN group archaeon]|nr:hypothetical protein [DPANN group archaeon]